MLIEQTIASKTKLAENFFEIEVRGPTRGKLNALDKNAKAGEAVRSVCRLWREVFLGLPNLSVSYHRTHIGTPT